LDKIIIDCGKKEVRHEQLTEQEILDRELLHEEELAEQTRPKPPTIEERLAAAEEALLMII
jgi:hypothetical protein